jgi:REP-associated tyrosine transposase
MSRPLRIEYPGAWYHVMNRGRWGEEAFFSDLDHEAFVKVLRETSELWNMRVSAYCLMPNNYDLLVQTPDGNLSRCMRHVNGVYTQRFNRCHKKEGQLFRGRYKAVLVEGDSHLLEVLRYIHRNPLKAGIVKTLDNYPWSSHQGYLSGAKKWSWLEKDILLTQLSRVKSKQKSTYLDFVSLENSQEIESFYSLKNMPSILGGTSFKEHIKEKFYELTNIPEISGAKNLAQDAEKVIFCVCEYYRVSRSDLLISRRGTENLPRDIAIYLVRQLCRLTLPCVGEEFGINNYSTVSSVVQRVKLRLEKDKYLQREVDDVRKKVLKSRRWT